MSDEDQKELSSSIAALTKQVDSLGWVLAELTKTLKAILEELQHKK